MWRAEGKTSGKCAFQVHFPLAATGKIVRKIERKTVALIGGTGEPLSVYFFFGFHQREAQPRVCSGNKFTEQFHVDTGGVTFGKVASVITNPYIVYIIRYEIAQCFVIHFHGEAERAVHGTEIIVATCHEVQGALRTDVTVQRYGSYPVHLGGIPEFFIEWCLVIDSGSYSQGEFLIECRNQSQGGTRAENEFFVPVPVTASYTGSQGE